MRINRTECVRIAGTLGHYDRRILACLMDDPGITQKEVAARLSRSYPGIRMKIARMRRRHPELFEPNNP